MLIAEHLLINENFKPLDPNIHVFLSKTKLGNYLKIVAIHPNLGVYARAIIRAEVLLSALIAFVAGMPVKSKELVYVRNVMGNWFVEELLLLSYDNYGYCLALKKADNSQLSVVSVYEEEACRLLTVLREALDKSDE